MTAISYESQYWPSYGYGGKSTYAVPEPIRRGRDTNATRSYWQREDLSDDNPRTRTPRGSEEGNVEADERNHSGHSSIVMPRFLASGNTNDTDDKLHNDHSCASDDEDPTATEAFDYPEG